MKRKLMRSGNKWAIFISKTIIELMKINPNTDFLDIEIEKDILKIQKSKEADL